jgi:hypothetical protein
MTAGLDWFPLGGSSMWPLGPGWQAGVRKVTVDALRPGDVVAFVGTRPGAAWFHRVQAIDDRGIHTRGDTHHKADAPWPAEALMGRIEALSFKGVTIPIRTAGWRDVVWRHGGRSWARLAPRLRRAWRMWTEC